MNTTLEKLKERIKDKKYKLTTQRQTILQAFIDADENHLSAEDVYVLVKEVAVSYTHLRAHETRRHLVCRLLLEKKK